MKTKLLAAVSTVAFLGACGTKEPPPLVSTPEIKYKTQKVAAAISVVPKWYKRYLFFHINLICFISSNSETHSHRNINFTRLSLSSSDSPCETVQTYKNILMLYKTCFPQ